MSAFAAYSRQFSVVISVCYMFNKAFFCLQVNAVVFHPILYRVIGIACSQLIPTQLVYQTLTSSNRPFFNRGVATLLVMVLLWRPNEYIKKWLTD